MARERLICRKILSNTFSRLYFLAKFYRKDRHNILNKSIDTDHIIGNPELLILECGVVHIIAKLENQAGRFDRYESRWTLPGTFRDTNSNVTLMKIFATLHAGIESVFVVMTGSQHRI